MPLIIFLRKKDYIMWNLRFLILNKTRFIRIKKYFLSFEKLNANKNYWNMMYLYEMKIY